MIDGKIRNAAVALAALAGTVSEEQWALLSSIKEELLDAAEQVKVYESLMPVELFGTPCGGEVAHG